MHRILFQIGDFPIYTYGVMQGIAFIAAILVIYRLIKGENIERERILDLSVWAVTGGIIGARLWFVVENFYLYKPDFFSAFKIWEGGMVFYGGLLGGVLAGIIYLKKNRMSIPKIGDLMMPGFALAIFFGRIGCFLNGCCYGRIDYKWGIRFPSAHFPPPYYDQLKKGLIDNHAHSSLPVIPTQLISAFDAVLIFFTLLFLRKYKKFDGFIFYMFFVLYGTDRFFTDFLREYSSQAMILKVFSLSQFLSLLLILFGITMLTISFFQNRKKTS